MISFTPKTIYRMEARKSRHGWDRVLKSAVINGEVTIKKVYLTPENTEMKLEISRSIGSAISQMPIGSKG